MKTLIVLLLTTISLLADAPKGWTSDYDAALKKASREKKLVLLEFTGSDWCHSCQMMSRNVFSKGEFVQKASAKFVLLELDFPRGNKAITEKNKPLAQKYKITGYPTAVVLDSTGKEKGRFSPTSYSTVRSLLGKLEKF